MPNQQQAISPVFQRQAISDWFDGFIGRMKADKFMMESDIATTATKALYGNMILGSEASNFMMVRTMSSMYFIKELIQEYLNEVSQSEKKPNKLGLDLNDSKILVWAEINDEDEDSEDRLIMAEAKVNAKFSEFGFYIQSTIVEKSDCLSIPPHYQTLIG